MLTGIVLTKNEAENIEACLASLAFCDQIVVIDDNSVDGTVKIAKKMGAEVLVHALDNNFASQHNWSLEQIKSPWVLFIDADERISPELAAEIKVAIEKIEFKGFFLPRVDYLWGKELKYGDLYGAKFLRLARRGAGIWRGKVHESWVIEGRTGKLKNPLLHYPHQNFVEFLQHINTYSTIKADEFFNQNKKTSVLEIIGGPIWRFFKAYILQLGFLDGTAGFVHAMTLAMYQFLVAGKLHLHE